MKHIFTLMMMGLLLLLQSNQVNGQIVASVSVPKKQYLAYEDVNLSVTMTNRAGQPIEFSNKLGRKWIEFIVERGNGDTVFAVRDEVYAPLFLNTAETRTSSFRLNNGYDLTEPGNYMAFAVIRMPGQTAQEGTRTQKVHFTVITGIPSWKQRAGVPGAPGDTREYRLINVTNDTGTELYVQIEDVKRSKMLVTYSLGRNLAFRDFTATLDSLNRMNVLFRTTPTIYNHTIVDAGGTTALRQYHKKVTSTVAPKLMTSENGLVTVVDSIPYDPQKEQDLRSQIHNLSELPAGL